MYLRTVFGSRPVRRAIAVTDSPGGEDPNHHQFSQLDHRRRPHPNRVGGNGRRRTEKPEPPGARSRNPGKGASQGIFDAHNQGVFNAR